MPESPRYSATLSEIRDSLRDAADLYLPAGEYHRFYQWALSPVNPERDDFCQLIALNQLSRLAVATLSGLTRGGAEDNEWPTLLQYAIPFTIGQVFEVVSDDLALGMAPIRPTTPHPPRDLLVDFNRAIVEDLRNPSSKPAATLIEHLRGPAGTISSFAKSLAPERHADTARRYLGGTRDDRFTELEHSLWPGLVANMEAGRAVLGAITGSPLEPMVRSTTVDRYTAVIRLLRGEHLPLLERITLGVRTILVMPTLAYLAAALDLLSGPDPALIRTIEDGTLLETLADAALLVRMQNDLGTLLLEQHPGRRRALLDTLPRRFPAPPGQPDDTIALLTRAAERLPVLNRLHKDLETGEFNICLHDMHRIPDVAAALPVLADSLDYCAELHRHHRAQFEHRLGVLRGRLRDERIVAAINRFIKFHENMYRHDYTQRGGDYAI